MGEYFAGSPSRRHLVFTRAQRDLPRVQTAHPFGYQSASHESLGLQASADVGERRAARHGKQLRTSARVGGFEPFGEALQDEGAGRESQYEGHEKKPPAHQDGLSEAS